MALKCLERFLHTPVAITTSDHLCQVDGTVAEHQSGAVGHLAVHPVVDHHVVHDVLHVRLVLLHHTVLLRLTLYQHLKPKRGKLILHGI